MNSSGTSSSPEYPFQGAKSLQPSCHTTGSLKTIFDDDASHSFDREPISLPGFHGTTPQTTTSRQPMSNECIGDVDRLSNVSDHSTQFLGQPPNQNFLNPLLWYPNISQSPPEFSSFEKVRAEIVEILSPMSENESSGARQRQTLEGTIAEPKAYYEQISNAGNHLATFSNDPNLPNVDVISSSKHMIGQNVVSSRSSLREHIATTQYNSARHHGAGNAFSTRSQLGMRGVSKKRSSSSSNSTCSICGKTYTESSNLSKHFRTVHLKLRPFQCHICPSSFAEKNKLGKHIQSVHEHARPFKCDLCNATFSQASDRKRHRLVLHEGCRPYICEVCGKAFGRRSSLTQHSQRVHKMLSMSLAISAEPSIRGGGIVCDAGYSSQGFRQIDSINSNDNTVLVQPLESPLIPPTMQPLSRMIHLMLPVSSSGGRTNVQ